MAKDVYRLILITGLMVTTMMLLQSQAVENVNGTKFENSRGEVSLEESFVNIQKLDDQECIPRLLCEMAANARIAPLSMEETSILNVFNNGKILADKNSKSPLSIYKFAIELGSGGTDEHRCQQHFSKCPLIGRALTSAFKSIVVAKN